MLFTARLASNAEVKTVKGDKTVTNFSVALNQRYTNKTGEKKEKTVFIDCAFWRNSGIAEYLRTGAVVEISGWIEAQAYESKKDGLKARLICTCDAIKLFSFPAKNENKAGNKETAIAQANGAADDDDLPF